MRSVVGRLTDDRSVTVLWTERGDGDFALPPEGGRKAVLDAVQRLCPELTALMNLFYTVDGACFFAVDGVVEVILSAEGVRMGCPLGSFGFDLALHFFRIRALVRVVVGADIRGDREPGRHGETDTGHFCEVGTFAAEERLHLAVSISLASPPGVNIFALAGCCGLH